MSKAKSLSVRGRRSRRYGPTFHAGWPTTTVQFQPRNFVWYARYIQMQTMSRRQTIRQGPSPALWRCQHVSLSAFLYICHHTEIIRQMESLSQRGAREDAWRPIESGIGSPRGVIRLPVHFSLIPTFSMCSIFSIPLGWFYYNIQSGVLRYLSFCSFVVFRDPWSLMYRVLKGLIIYTCHGNIVVGHRSSVAVCHDLACNPVIIDYDNQVSRSKNNPPDWTSKRWSIAHLPTK